MSHLFRLRRPLFALSFALTLAVVSMSAQRRDGVPALPPPDGPVVLRTAEVPRIRVVPIVGFYVWAGGMVFGG